MVLWAYLVVGHTTRGQWVLLEYPCRPFCIGCRASWGRRRSRLSESARIPSRGFFAHLVDMTRWGRDLSRRALPEPQLWATSPLRGWRARSARPSGLDFKQAYTQPTCSLHRDTWPVFMSMTHSGEERLSPTSKDLTLLGIGKVVVGIEALRRINSMFLIDPNPLRVNVFPRLEGVAPAVGSAILTNPFTLPTVLTQRSECVTTGRCPKDLQDRNSPKRHEQNCSQDLPLLGHEMNRSTPGRQSPEQ